MRPPGQSDEEERPLAWMAILDQTPVFSSDEQEVGVIREVLGAEVQDVFHGIVVDQGNLGEQVMVPADRVEAITNRRVRVAMTSEEFRSLPPYQADESYRLGLVGLFAQRLGWVRDRDQPG